MTTGKSLLEMANEIFSVVDGRLIYKERLLSRGRRSEKAGTEAGWDCGHGYRKVKFDKQQFYTHQIVFLLAHGYIPQYIDHVDGNGLNNRVENLRPCTKSENCYNSAIPKTNKSGVKNVEWSKQKNKWHCKMTVNKKSIHIGFFDDLELAALVALEAREKFHGKFANHGVAV